MNITISTDKSKLDLILIHRFLSEESYWAKNIPFAIVKASIDNSLCFGLYDDDKQVGFARVVSDFSVFAYLADVFIVPGYRGKGLSKQLLQFIVAYPALQGLRRWMLATADAHELYKKYGFKELAKPSQFLEIVCHSLYENKGQ